MNGEPVRGVYNILSTPFAPEGELDEGSLRRLVEATIGAGVTGVTALGVAGETQKLTDDERRRVIQVVMEVNAGRVPVIVGTSRDGTIPTIIASQEAHRLGAAGVMIAPPTFTLPGPALTRHFERIGAAIDIPITLQDFPAANAVTMTPRQMAELAEAVPAIVTIKLEDPPTPLRIAQTLALTGERVSLVGGNGGIYLLDELRRGAAGTMTGFSYPEVLLRIVRSWQERDEAEAARVYYRYLPLLVFEFQPKIGVAVRKEMLRRRGLIDNATVRQPGPSLDHGLLEDLDKVLAEVGLGSGAEAAPP